MSVNPNDQTKLNDLTKEALSELRKVDHARTEELMNAAILVMALCQQKLQLRSLRSTMQPGGNVVVSTVFDAEGKSTAVYATVDRVTGKISVSGFLSEPRSDDYDIEKTMDPKPSE